MLLLTSHQYHEVFLLLVQVFGRYVGSAGPIAPSLPTVMSVAPLERTAQSGKFLCNFFRRSFTSCSFRRYRVSCTEAAWELRNGFLEWDQRHADFMLQSCQLCNKLRMWFLEVGLTSPSHMSWYFVVYKHCGSDIITDETSTKEMPVSCRLTLFMGQTEILHFGLFFSFIFVICRRILNVVHISKSTSTETRSGMTYVIFYIKHYQDCTSKVWCVAYRVKR